MLRNTGRYLSILQYHQGGIWLAWSLFSSRTTISGCPATDSIAPTDLHIILCVWDFMKRQGFKEAYIHRSSVLSYSMCSFGTTFQLCASVFRRIGAVNKNWIVISGFLFSVGSSSRAAGQPKLLVRTATFASSTRCFSVRFGRGESMLENESKTVWGSLYHSGNIFTPT